jgi:hypothetical protein
MLCPYFCDSTFHAVSIMENGCGRRLGFSERGALLRPPDGNLACLA